MAANKRTPAQREAALAASRLAVMVCRAVDRPRRDGRYCPAYAAANSVGFCLMRPAREALREAAYWTADGFQEPHMYDLEGAERFLADLKARLG
jgi:hypothetical protein